MQSNKPKSQKPDVYPKIYLFGDSLTERSFEAETGFGKVLTDYYAGKAQVMDIGVSGFNSTWLRTYFTTDIIRDLQSRKCPPPLFITIFLGANDACLPSFSAHVPLPEYEVNLRYYVDAILNHPATQGTKVILITPPPIDIAAPKRDDFEIPAVTKELRQSPTKGVGFLTCKSKQTYAEKVMEIAHSYEEKTPLVAGLDLWKAFMEFGRNRSQGEDPRTSVEDNEQPLPGSGLSGAHEFGRDVFADGLHFGPVGNDLLTTELMTLITTKWPELRREELPI